MDLMIESTTEMGRLVESLSLAARRRGMNYSRWAAAAGLPKETLSRLRSRDSCDLRTLLALAAAVGARLEIAEGAPTAATADGHFPARIDREYEARLRALCASGTLDPDAWRALGPPFFMAGIAVMLASVRGAPRQAYLGLAERLHPGSTRPDLFHLWLSRSPLKASRFLPMLLAQTRRAA